jgi:hypothetical protein
MENLGFTGNVHTYIYIHTYMYIYIEILNGAYVFFAPDSDPNCETKLVSAVLMN